MTEFNQLNLPNLMLGNQCNISLLVDGQFNGTVIAVKVTDLKQLGTLCNKTWPVSISLYSLQ